VHAGVERMRDGLGHLNLAAPLAATQRGDRLGQQFGDFRCLARCFS
jgi:hypothetical protein